MKENPITLPNDIPNPKNIAAGGRDNDDKYAAPTVIPPNANNDYLYILFI